MPTYVCIYRYKASLVSVCSKQTTAVVGLLIDDIKHVCMPGKIHTYVHVYKPSLVSKHHVQIWRCKKSTHLLWLVWPLMTLSMCACQVGSIHAYVRI
jgi:hypothetical protein